jgi:hypothetical protein
VEWLVEALSRKPGAWGYEGVEGLRLLSLSESPSLSTYPLRILWIDSDASSDLICVYLHDLRFLLG